MRVCVYVYRRVFTDLGGAHSNRNGGETYFIASAERVGRRRDMSWYHGIRTGRRCDGKGPQSIPLLGATGTIRERVMFSRYIFAARRPTPSYPPAADNDAHIYLEKRTRRKTREEEPSRVWSLAREYTQHRSISLLLLTHTHTHVLLETSLSPFFQFYYHRRNYCT